MFLAASGFADVLGSALIQRSYNGTDYCTGCLFAYAQVPLGDSGQQLSSWSFYAAANPSFPTNGNANGVGNLITPLIFNSSFTLIGIGTTQASTGPGIQSYAFGLTSGTDVLAAGDWLGWRDGSVSSQNNGTISLDMSGGPGLFYHTCDNPTADSNGTTCYYSASDPNPVTVGDTLSFSDASTSARSYSVEYTTTPEPAFYGALAVGLAGLIVTVRRRKKA